MDGTGDLLRRSNEIYMSVASTQFKLSDFVPTSHPLFCEEFSRMRLHFVDYLEYITLIYVPIALPGNWYVVLKIPSTRLRDFNRESYRRHRLELVRDTNNFQALKRHSFC